MSRIVKRCRRAFDLIVATAHLHQLGTLFDCATTQDVHQCSCAIRQVCFPTGSRYLGYERVPVHNYSMTRTRILGNDYLQFAKLLQEIT